MTAASLSDLARRVGGPNSVTVPGFLMSLGFTTVFGAAGASVSGAGPIWIVPALAGQTTAYGVLAVARRTVLRRTRLRPRPIRTVLCFAVAAAIGGSVSGGIARMVTGAGADNAPPPPGPLAAVAVLATLLAFTLVSSFTAVVVDAWREHRAWTAERRAWLDRLDYLRLQASDDLAHQRRRHHDAVTAALRDLVEATPTTPLPDLAVMLRSTAANTVRPAGHRLARTPVPEVPATPPAPASLAEFVHDLTRQQLVRPLSLTLLASMPGGLFALLDRPSSGTVSFVAVGAGALLALALLLSTVTDRVARPGHRLLMWPAGILTLALSSALVAAVIDDDGRSAAAALTAYSVAFFGLLQPTWHAGRQAFEAGMRERTELARAVSRETTDLRQRERIEQDRLAKALHGRVQSTLLASALRLSEVDGDETEARRHLEQTLGALSTELVGEARHRSIVDAVTDLRAVWSGLCRIDADLDAIARLDLPVATSTVLQSVMTELTTNSIVHGSASRLAVHISVNGDDTVTVGIDADGTVDTARARGLGSAILDELATTWSVTAVDGGVVSRAVLPVGSDRWDGLRPPRSAGSPSPVG